MSVEIKEQTALAIVSPEGEIIEIGPSLPVVTLEQAEAYLPVALAHADALDRFIGFLRAAVGDGWKAKGQREGILGGIRWALKAKPTPWVYEPDEMFNALLPFVGRVITREELVEALGWSYIPAQVVPERIEYAPTTAKVDVLARRGDEIAAVIAAHRQRAEGVEVLVKK
jgi:hypothetical protein